MKQKRMFESGRMRPAIASALKSALVSVLIPAVFFSCSTSLLEKVQKETEAAKVDERAVEKRKPVIDTFQWENIVSLTTNDPAVTLTITASAKAIGSGGKNAVIKGYLLRESDTAPAEPALDDAAWTEAAPTSFAFTAANGAHTLYAWTKDSLGNISESGSLEITLSPLGASWNVAENADITLRDALILTSLEDLDSAVAVTAAGTLLSSVDGYRAVLSGEGSRIVTISPGADGAGVWATGTGLVLSVTAKTAKGLTLTPSVTLGTDASLRKPEITALSWQDAASGTTNNPTVALTMTAAAKATSVTSGAATIAGYLVRETSAAPSLDDSAWKTAVPTSFTFTATNGSHTMYAWVKDSLGNLSAVSSLPVTLEVLGAAWATPFADGVIITAHENIILTSSEDMDTTGSALSGTMLAAADSYKITLSGTGNRTITLSPGTAGTGLWAAGTALTLTYTGKTAKGLTLTKSVSLSPFKGMCVSDPTVLANAVDDGTVLHPYRVIKQAVTAAKTKYQDQGTSECELRVGSGTYTSAYSTNGAVLTIRGGISVYGSYDSTFSARSLNPPTSTLQDSSTDISSSSSQYRAVEADSLIPSATTATILDGFIIKSANMPGVAKSIAAVYLEASPTIRNCKITSYTSAAISYGVYVYKDMAPIIQANTIQSGKGSISIGIYIDASTAQPRILDNEITAGEGTTVGSRGLEISSTVTAIVAGNTISAGMSSLANTSNGILNKGNPTIYNNVILGGKNANCYGFYNSAGNPIIRNNSIEQGESSGIGTEYAAVYILNGMPTIENNILFKKDPGYLGYGVYEKNIGADPVSLKNNDFYNYGATALYYDFDTSAGLSNIATLNGLAGSAGNIDSNPEFESLLNSDYRLKTASPVKATGLNGNAQSPAWGFLIDKNNIVRTPSDATLTGWSIGAYEKD